MDSPKQMASSKQIGSSKQMDSSKQKNKTKQINSPSYFNKIKDKKNIKSVSDDDDDYDEGADDDTDDDDDNPTYDPSEQFELNDIVNSPTSNEAEQDNIDQFTLKLREMETKFQAKLNDLQNRIEQTQIPDKIYVSDF